MEAALRVISLLGGLALFLYGMRTMGDGLKSSSGGALQAALEKVTDKPVKGFLLGLAVTCIIQSSTAAIVITVGLVGAGFLKFRQSIGIVLGANVGTAITAQIIRLMDVNAGAGSLLNLLDSDNLASLALIIGIILIMFVKKRAAGAIGTVLMGFGILFVGLMNMSAAVSTMNDELSRVLMSFEHNYFLGFIAGIVVTCIIESSSAAVGIVQSIASSIGVTFCSVFSILIGVNIGCSIMTFLICRIGARPEQIRVCMVHILYNIAAAVMVFSLVGIFRGTGILDDGIWYMTMASGGVANVHGIFRLVPAIVLLPFTGVFARLAERIIKDVPPDEEDTFYEEKIAKLDVRLIANPGLAIAEAKSLIGNMADLSMHNYEAVSQQMFSFEEERELRIRHREVMLDKMTDASNQYLLSISPNITLSSDRRNMNFLLKSLTCFERIGDLSLEIIDNLSTLRNEGKGFSSMATEELKIMMEAVHNIINRSVEAFNNNDVALAESIEPLEEVIDEMVEKVNDGHVDRMACGQCEVFSGIQFQNILLDLERIADQCSDLALFLIGRANPEIEGNEHLYLHELHHSPNSEYTGHFESYHEKYFRLLNSIDPSVGK